MKKSAQFFSSKISKVILVGAVFGLLVFLNPNNFFNPIRSALFFVTSPLQKGISGIFYTFKGGGDFISSIWKLKTDNEQLLKNNYDLQSKLITMKELEKENNFLREQAGLLPRDKFVMQAASIVGRDSYNLGNWIQIDKGERDGLQKDMPVIIGNGIMIGKVNEVNYSTAKVILITNPESIVNSLDVETEAKGVVKGEFGLGIRLDMVLPTETITVGDAVATSGLGNQTPRGLLIGNISEVKMSSDGLFQQAVLSSPIDFSKLYQVFIIKSFIR